MFSPRYREQVERKNAVGMQRAYDARWNAYSKQYRIEHPLCVECLAEGVDTPTAVVDHITPPRGRADLMWDPTNHQPLCKRHHDQKTATEDGGFGNPMKVHESG